MTKFPPFLHLKQNAIAAAFMSILVFSLLWSPNHGLALTVEASAEVEGDFSSVTINMVVKRITASQIANNPSLGKAELESGYIDVIIPKSDSNPIYRTSPTPSTTTNFNDEFYWEMITGEITTDPDHGTEYRATIQLSIKQNAAAATPTAFKDIFEDNKEAVAMKVRFNSSANGSDFNTNTDGGTISLTAEKIFSKPNEAPTNFAATGVYRGVKFTWDAKDSVAYTNASINRKPSSVVAFVFNSAAANVSLAAKTVDDTAGNHTQSTCTYVNASTCITCPQENDFVLSEQELNATGLVQVETTTNTGAGRVSNIEPEQSYVIAMQYKDGTKRTKCIEVTPTENITLSELYGDISAYKDPRCFVATAAFGSSDHQQVLIFRWFRNTFLLTNSLGRSLVEAYYSSSQPLAESISKSPTLATAFRVLLWLPASFLHGLKYALSNPLNACLALIAAFIMISILSSTVLRRPYIKKRAH